MSQGTEDVQGTVTEVVAGAEKVICGKRLLLETVLTCLIAGERLLMEDLPGTGKTLLAKALFIGTDKTLTPGSGYFAGLWPIAERLWLCQAGRTA